MYEAKFGRTDGLALRGLRWLERITFRTADVVIATNESHKRIAVERGGVPAERVYVVRSGPDLGRLETFPPDPSWKAGKRFLLTYLGEICAQDGVEYLVQAMRVLRDDLARDDVQCVLVGGGPHQDAVRRYAREQGVDDVCTFTGRVSDEDLCRVLSSADVAVDPDPKTPWSDQSTMNKIMEYMFFGLPIVGFALTENRTSAREAMVVVDGNDPAGLARAIRDLLDEPARREMMSQSGKARLRSALAWEHSVPHLLAAYEAALNGR
jgi:glycosyltransferase involved in cell wall biosynthesis